MIYLSAIVAIIQTILIGHICGKANIDFIPTFILLCLNGTLFVFLILITTKY